MQNLKKFLSLALALVIVFGAVAPAMAAGESKEPDAKTETVVLHKILQTKANLDNAKFPGTEGLDGTKYDGNEIEKIADYFGEGSRPIAGVFFAVQNSEGKYLGKDGTVLANQDIKDANFKTSVLGGETTTDGLILYTSELTQKNTEYKIVEIVELSTYKSEDGKLLAAKKAVPVEITLPLTNENGVVTEAHVYPKNTEEKPEIDKNFAKKHGLQVIEDEKGNNNAGADYENYLDEKAKVTAELGKKIPYEVKTKILKDSHYKKLVWNDTMTDGLTFNKDLKVSGAGLTTDDYTIVATDRGFTLILKESGLTKVENAAKTADVEITLTYSATVNNAAVVDHPDKNKVELNYSNKPGKDNEPKETTPLNQQITVNKSWETKNTDGSTSSNVPAGVSVVYTLQEKVGNDWKDVTSVTKTGTDFNHTFEGLDNTKTYRVVETVSGYEVEYLETDANGVVSIKNNKDNDNPTPLIPTGPEVEYYGKRFVKADANTGERLQGAEFVIKNNNEGENKGKYLALKDINTTDGEGKALKDDKDAYDAAINAWNDAVKNNPDKADEEIEVIINGVTLTGKTAVMDKIAELQGLYETAFKAAKNAYTWVDSQDAANVVTLVSDEEGKFEIVGLEKGSYTLVETKTPGNYAKLNDQNFQVGPGTYTSHVAGVKYEGTDNVVTGVGNEAQRVDNKLVSIPQTGGIGTVIFTVGGIALMGGAAIAMKKNKEEDEE